MTAKIMTAKYDVISDLSDLLDLENSGSLILLAQPIKTEILSFAIFYLLRT